MVHQAEHGGAFWEALGEDFLSLERAGEILAADVLDAWFDPAPEVVRFLREHAVLAAKTSPPTHAEGLVRALSETRELPETSLLTGGGSSNLIFLALREWLRPESRALILDPTYGEYAHVLERVVWAQLDRYSLEPRDQFKVNVSELADRIRQGRYDLVALVNPNSPTGQALDHDAMRTLLDACPAETLFWVDETYVEFAEGALSVERWTEEFPQLVVCKSMSKAYALSGLRVGYLAAQPAKLEPLRAFMPPWSVSFMAQMAACLALRDPDYYAERYRETRSERGRLARELASLGFDPVIEGETNFLLFHAANAPNDLLARCREQGLFLRDATSMGERMKDWLRLGVQTPEKNRRMLEILSQALSS